MSFRRFVPTCLLAGVVSLPGLRAEALFRQEPGQIVLAGDAFTVRFSDTNGSILDATGVSGGSVLHSGLAGLWQAFFQGGGTAQAAIFRTGSAQNTFAWSLDGAQGPLRLFYTNAQLVVNVSVSGLTNGVDLSATVEPRGTNVLTELALPGRLQFVPEDLNRFVGAMHSSDSVGAAFKAGFFQAQPPEAPAGWQTRVVGPSGYISLFGGPLVSRADNDPPTPVSITTDGRAWLGNALADRLQGAAAMVNRPSTRSQTPLILADSTNGPYFSGSQLGGSGWLLRVGGSVGDSEKGLVQDLVTASIEHLAAAAPAGRTQVGLIALTRGPSSGGWAGVSVAEWRARLRASTVLTAGGFEVVEFINAQQVLTTLRTTNLLALINPYGEWTPVLEQTGMSGMVGAVRAFVRGGGCWVETGGYPFYYELRPTPFFSYESLYPPAFADFLHVDATAGRASVYGVQPQVHAPWSGSTDPTTIFVPGRLAWGGETNGGYCERRFGPFIPAGQRWQSPSVRLVLGPTAEDALAGYAAANRFERRLDQKLAPDLLPRFKQSVLVYYAGSCAEKNAHLDQLPVPTLVHFADYLKGGFDKEYPDHLPPSATFGTTNDLRAFLARCRSLGHLVMPYTNPTWWCDHPWGPTFLREGEAPLLRRADGSLSYERYDANDGYTVCHWHPAVRAANAVTLRQFTEEFPVDVLFQDQCGARTWQYDFNAASPTVYAYADGLCSMVAEDARSRPLSTENGWDRLVNHEAQFCGLTWAIVPTQDAPAWRVMLDERFPSTQWDLFPLAQILAHDKVSMIHHDLGQFVSNHEVLAWTLGLGYGLSLRVGASELDLPRTREWLRWLARLQQSVCARYVGEPIRSFTHERPDPTNSAPGGIIRATYGPVNVRANLGPDPLVDGGTMLAGHGFEARAPGLLAGRFARIGTNEFGTEGVAFVCEGAARAAEFWIYSRGDRRVAIEAPEPADGSVMVQLDGESAREARMQSGVVPVNLSSLPNAARLQPPPELAGLAPRDWPAGKPAIGVLDLPGFPRSWTSITPTDWYQALAGSRVATEWGAPIRRITTTNALVAALQAGPTQWLAILNPSGEQFPMVAAAAWQPMLQLVRDYVNRGGSWWETAGYSFYAPTYLNGAAWQTQSIGPAGMGYFGLPVGSGDVAQSAEALSVTSEGRELLGDAVADQLSGLTSSVNRGLPRTAGDPGHLAVLAGAETDFLGGYRLEGWGFLWRTGGFNPDRAVLIPATVGVIEYLYSHPPLPVPSSTMPYLWHGTVTWKGGAVLRAVATPPASLTVMAAECPPGAVNSLERSRILGPTGQWEEVLRFNSPPQQTNWVDAEASQAPQAFYRVRSAPGK
jgi:hypothetical protein